MNLKALKNYGESSRKISDDEINNELKSFEIIDTIDKDFIASVRDRIWELLSMSYETILGVTERNITKVTYLLSYVVDEGEIIACSLYRDRLGGLKAMYVGCDQTQNGKEALYTILRRDAKDENDVGYWIEASGVIEHLMAKYDANPIPNVYAEYLLKKQVVLDNDNVHYTRCIGEYQDVRRKIIFGFPNKEFYYRVISEYENYTEFKRVMNDKILKTVSDSLYSEKYPAHIVEDLDIVNVLANAYEDGMLDCLTDNMYDYLVVAKTELEEYNHKESNSQINSCIDYAEVLLELPKLECHEIQV